MPEIANGRRFAEAGCQASAEEPHTICIATRSLRETFIRAHVECLPGRVHVLQVPPHRDEEGRSILPPSAAHAARLVARGLRRDPDRLEDLVTSQLPARSRAHLYARHLRRIGARVVLAEFGYEAVAIHPGCLAAGVPLVAHFHGYDAFQEDIVDHFGPGYRSVFAAGWPVVAVSQSMKRQLVNLGATDEQVFVNPYGVDMAAFEGAEPEPGLVVAVGRLVPKKAPHLTLLAFAEALKRVPHAHLVMVGDGPLRPVVDNIVAARHLQDRVTLLGHRAHEDVVSYIRRASVFVQHSVIAANGDREGTPVAIIEAGAAGVPVVATHHEGIPEVVLDGETGILVDERDVTAMASALADVLSQPSLARRLGDAARRRIEDDYSMEGSIQGLWRILERAMEAHPHRTGASPPAGRSPTAPGRAAP